MGDCLQLAAFIMLVYNMWLY